MYEALTNAGAAAEMHIFSGQPHAFDAAPDYGREIASLIDLFLRRNVLGIVPAGAREAVAAGGGRSA
jgi:acetyl esterase/lipase